MVGSRKVHSGRHDNRQTPTDQTEGLLALEQPHASQPRFLKTITKEELEPQHEVVTV